MENKKLNYILAKMQDDPASLAMSCAGIIFILAALIGLFRHLMVGVIIGLIIVSLACWIIACILFQKHMKKDNVSLLITNMKAKGIKADADSIADIEMSLNEEYIERRLFTITKKYFISFGKDNTNFEPLCIPREMIEDVAAVDMHIGFGKASSDIVVLKLKLNNGIEPYCCIGLKSQIEEIRILEKAGILFIK